MKNILISTVITGLCTLGVARAQTIVSDTYSGADNTYITSHTPDTNVTGSGYVATPNFFYNTPPGTQTDSGNPSDTGHNVPEIQGNQLQFDGTASAAINISSAGTYTKPTTLTISADLDNSSIGGDAINFSRGFALGYYSSFNANGSSEDNKSNFNGVQLNAADGNLSLFNAGNNYIPGEQVITYDTADLGAYSESTVYTLGYTIDTTTGFITTLTFSDAAGSVTYTDPFSASGDNVFTAANTTYASVTTFTANYSGEYGYADNFLVTGPNGASVPEPASYALLLAGAAALVGYRRFQAARS